MTPAEQFAEATLFALVNSVGTTAILTALVLSKRACRQRKRS